MADEEEGSFYSLFCLHIFSVSFQLCVDQKISLLSGPVEVALSGFMRAFPIKKKPVASGNYTKQCSDRL